MKRFATIAGASVAAVAVSTTMISVTAASAAPHDKAGHSRSETVPGAAAQKAIEAALVAVPGGTVQQVNKAKDGSLRVIVRTADGVKKVITLDASYTVVSVQNAKGKRGKHGRHGTDVTGEEFTKAEAAALSAVPDGTVVDVHKRGPAYHVLAKKADGTKVLVTLDADFAVTGTKTFTMTTKN